MTRFHRTLLTGAAAGFLCLCGVLAAWAQDVFLRPAMEEFIDKDTRLVFPAQVDTFQKVRVRKNENPVFGTVVRYENELGSCADVYIYSLDTSAKPVPQELFEKITNEYNLKTFHSVSLTGGEPLLNADFLAEFLPLIKNKVEMYLETNATMPENLLKVKPYLDIVSADIKLKSSTGLDTTKLHEKFFENCNGVETFAKIVFDSNITDDEISKCCSLALKYNIPLVLQPKMVDNKMSVSPEFCEEVLDKFTLKYNNVRLIPQVHKFLNIR